MQSYRFIHTSKYTQMWSIILHTYCSNAHPSFHMPQALETSQDVSDTLQFDRAMPVYCGSCMTPIFSILKYLTV